MPILNKISPEKFVHANWCGRGFSLLDILDVDCETVKSGITLVGYCDAKRLGFRPRDEGHAIMFEIDGVVRWIHIWPGFVEE